MCFSMTCFRCECHRDSNPARGAKASFSGKDWLLMIDGLVMADYGGYIIVINPTVNS